MNNESTSVAERFGLQRDNYILDPLQDTACFARPDIDTRQIAESLDTDLVTGLAPKRLVWGPYGGGKTHTLMRTMVELEELTSIHAVRVECPDLSRKSRFHDLYREGIMRELGQNFVIGLIDEAVRAGGMARREEFMERLRETFGDEEIAKAASRIIDPNFEPLRLWRWISGVAMSRGELDDLGQTQDLTHTEAARLAETIVLVGRLLREVRQTTLVLVLDEMERLNSIGPETIGTFVSGFTRLVDPNQRYVSVLMGASAAVESEMVEVFSDHGPVVSRLGGLSSEAVIEIDQLHEPNVDQFIQDVIQYVRDTASDIDGLITNAQTQCAETIQENLFPFTDEAIDTLKSQLTQMMTPREITWKMTRALGRAYRRGQAVVTADQVA